MKNYAFKIEKAVTEHKFIFSFMFLLLILIRDLAILGMMPSIDSYLNNPPVHNALSR